MDYLQPQQGQISNVPAGPGTAAPKFSAVDSLMRRRPKSGKDSAGGKAGGGKGANKMGAGGAYATQEG